MSNFLDGVAELTGLECPLQSPGVNPAEPPFVVGQEGGAVDVTPSPAQLSSQWADMAVVCGHFNIYMRHSMIPMLNTCA